ncbi:GtrA family protein [Tessaracoccus caeni]|uniref:GtrA family protein n=1 Tax=Tessaracoccus caeni TaxID=3031239 RepID=UPI0023DAE6C9|nr:GtrA family protein [Tessaracoccus caeni]MDF1487936.1 GtrA family protein [Tessaracoccus caeni]
MTETPGRLGAWLRARGSFLRYALVGGFNSLLDLSLFSLFAVVAHLDVFVANVISTTITMCVSYLLNRFWVFRSDAGWASTAAGFVGVTLFSGLVIQSAVIWTVLQAGATVVPGLPYELLAPIAKACAMGVGMVTNYLGYRWLFGTRSAP